MGATRVAFWSGMDGALHTNSNIFWFRWLSMDQWRRFLRSSTSICAQSYFQCFIHTDSLSLAQLYARVGRCDPRAHDACLGIARDLTARTMGGIHQYSVPLMDELCFGTADHCDDHE